MRTKLHKMERGQVCAVAALRTVLHLQYDVNIPEVVLEALGDEAMTPIREYGTDVQQLRRMLREANRAFNTGDRWRFKVHRYGGWDTLFEATSRGRKPLVRVREPWLEHKQNPAGVDLHFVVVYDVDAAGDELKVFDPAYGKLHRMRWDDFLEWWTDTDGMRWCATVSP